jgi:hypothetical protein
MCTLVVNAQDSTLYKIKLEKFKSKEHGGKITTIVGGSAVVLGIIVGVVGESLLEGETRDAVFPIGFGVAGAGLIAIIPGSINWSIGKKKVKEYQIRLDDARSGFYISPDHAGLKLVFKF